MIRTKLALVSALLFGSGTPSARSSRSPVVLCAVVAACNAAFLMAYVAPAFVAPAEAAAGRLALAPGRSDSRGLPNAFVNGRASVSYVIPTRGGSGLYLAVALRAKGDRHGYRARLKVLPDGSLRASLSRVRDNHDRLIGRRRIPGKAKPGQVLRLQAAVHGRARVTLKLRAWQKGLRRPAWQLKRTETSARRISGSGHPRAWAYLSSSARRHVDVSYRNLMATPAPVPTTTSGKPSASTTGVPAGVVLTDRYGDITITRAGTHLDGLDIHGFVTVRAANVKITRSIIRGGTATSNRGMVTNYGYPNLVIQDSSFVPAHETVWQDGIKGSDFTARRVHIVGNVDSLKVQGDNVTVVDSLLENSVYYASDPNQGGGPSHNDGIQIQKGRNITIAGNTIRGHSNFAVLGAASIGATPNLEIRNNWVDGGHCTIKVEELNGYQVHANVLGNKFGPNRRVSYCPINATYGSKVTANANTFEVTSAPARVLWTN